MSTVSANVSAQNFVAGTFLIVFLKIWMLFDSWICAGRLFQARGPATRKARSPALVFVAGTNTLADFDDRSRDRFGSSDSGLILSAR